MNKGTNLNSELGLVINQLGHTDTIVISDAGLPIPSGVKCIDLAVTAGIVSFNDVLKVLLNELVVESAIVAKELPVDSVIYKTINDELGGLPCAKVDHEEFKILTKDCKCIVRTGEKTPYANIILVAGVDF